MRVAKAHYESVARAVAAMPLRQDDPAGTKIYAVAYNHFGDLTSLAYELGAEIYDNLLVFSNLDGQAVSDLLERHGIDYDYGYTPDIAQWCCD